MYQPPVLGHYEASGKNVFQSVPDHLHMGSFTSRSTRPHVVGGGIPIYSSSNPFFLFFMFVFLNSVL